MKDKNGVEIEVGDTVRFHHSNGDHKQGIITETGSDYYVVDKWSDDFGNKSKHIVSTYVEVISKEPEEFTKADQDVLDTLLAKQKQWDTARNNALIARRALVNTLYEMSEKIELGKYVSTHIDEICATLQACKKYHN